MSLGRKATILLCEVLLTVELTGAEKPEARFKVEQFFSACQGEKMQVTYRDRYGWESKKIWRYDKSHEITCNKTTCITISEEKKRCESKSPYNSIIET